MILHKMISIIVPIYNVAPYLNRCLDSIMGQGLDEGTFEVLLINDGSTDDSLHICEYYRSQHPQIFRILSKMNEGVSATRNLGIEQAKGDWIYFMDADDYLIPGGLSSVMRRYLDDSIDMLTFSAVTLTEEEHKASLQRLQSVYVPSGSKVIYEGDDCLREYSVNCAVWNCIIKRSFLVSGKGKHIRFPKMYIEEDSFFQLECALCRCRVKVVNDCIYHYIVRKSSAITSRGKTRMKEAISCFMTYFEHLDQLAAEWEQDPKMINAFTGIQTRLARPFFSRVLSADLSTKEFTHVMNDMQPHMRLIRQGTIKQLMMTLKKNPFMYPLASFLYRHIFMTIVYPFLSKN